MMNIVQKKLLPLVLAFCMLLCICGCAAGEKKPQESAAETVPSEPPLATFITSSDYQNSGTIMTFRMLLDAIRDAGVKTPDCALFGGDYSIPTETDPDDSIRKLTEKLTGVYPEFDSKNAIFVQGNHDNATEALSPTGAHDFGTFVVYSINEDDFPSGQKPEAVEKTLTDLDTFLSGMVKKKDHRPVIVAGHLPLHNSARADNACGGALAELLNSYGHTLDIVYLFGHNHSDNYDDSIGGSVNYIAKGEILYVPVHDEKGRIESSRKLTLTFSYLNYGYVGYSNSTVSGISTNVLTLGVLQVYADRIELTRYTAEGEYCSCSIGLQNTQTAQNAA